MRIPVQGPSDCGPASLTWAAHKLGRKLHFISVRLETGADACGSTALGIVRAAPKFGLSARGIRLQDTSADALQDLPTPWIAHGSLDKGVTHFVTVERMDRTRVTLYNPETNTRERWDHSKFLTFFSGVAIIVGVDASMPQTPASKRIPSTLDRCWSILWSQPGIMLQLLCCAMLSAILALGTSIFVQQLLDRVLPQGDWFLLNCLGLIMIGLLLARLLLATLQGRLSIRFAQRIDAILVSSYYQHLLTLPQQFFDSMRVGDMLARIGDSSRVRSFLHGTVTDLVLQPLFLLIALVAFFFYSWQLALLSLLLIPANMILFAVVNSMNKSRQRAVIESGASFETSLAESLHGNALTRQQGVQGLLALRTENRLVQLLRAHAPSRTPTWERVWLVSASGSRIF